MPHARLREVAEGDKGRGGEMWRVSVGVKKSARLDSTRLDLRRGQGRRAGGGRWAAVGGRRSAVGDDVRRRRGRGIKFEAISEPRACTPLHEPQAADPTAQRRSGRERVWCTRLVLFLRPAVPCSCANARPHESVQKKKLR